MVFVQTDPLKLCNEFSTPTFLSFHHCLGIFHLIFFNFFWYKFAPYFFFTLYWILLRSNSLQLLVLFWHVGIDIAVYHGFLQWTTWSINLSTRSFKVSPVGNCMFKVNYSNIRTRCDANGIVLVPLLLTLNIFHTLF